MQMVSESSESAEPVLASATEHVTAVSAREKRIFVMICGGEFRMLVGQSAFPKRSWLHQCRLELTQAGARFANVPNSTATDPASRPLLLFRLYARTASGATAFQF